MPKLKNFLQDLGSAVVPAAITAGLTYASGGTINPATTPGLLALLGVGKAGATGFAANEEEERRRKQMRRQAEENRRAQGTANLINALQPGTGARARPAEIAAPKAGLGETVARGSATGIQAFTMAKQAQEAWKERERQRVLTEQQIATGKDEAEIRSGAQQAYEELSRRDEEEGGLVDKITAQGKVLRGTATPDDIATAHEPAGGLQSWGSERGIPGAGPGFGTPDPQVQALQDMMGGQPALPPTGAAAVGYHQVMEEDRQRRFEESLKVEEQDIRQRTWEYNKQRADEQSAYQRLQLEADRLAVKATRDYKAGQTRDSHRIDTEKRIGEMSSVKRLDQFRRNYQAIQNLLDTIKEGQAQAALDGVPYEISGTTQIGLLNLFHNMIDPATVREGDVALYRTQAQGMFDQVQLNIGKIINNKSGVVSDTLLDGMEGTLNILKGGYEQAASEQMGRFFDARLKMGLEHIPTELTTGLRDASFTAYGLPDPVENAELLKQQIADAQNAFKSWGPEAVSGGPFTTTAPLGAGGGVLMRPDSRPNIPYTAPAEGGDLSAGTQPFPGVTTSAGFAETPELGAVSAAPATTLAKIGGARPQIGGARGAISDYYAPQTDFSRMTDDEKRKLLGETAVDYAGRGGRFAYDNILQPLGALAAGTLPRIYGYKQPGNKR